MTAKIGFACKWIDHTHQIDAVSSKDDAQKYNTGTTTATWLARQTRSVAEERLWHLLNHNAAATLRLIEQVGSLDDHLRMVRIGSEMLPMYTHPEWREFWKTPEMQLAAEQRFSLVGDAARNRAVRLSMHPDHFVVLASDNPDIVTRSMEEFEYHADLARWMGFGKTFQDFKINVHISGRGGPDAIRKVYPLLSTEARNCITIENEENSWGLEDCLSLGDLLPTVMDIHHHWCREGEYISPDDDRVSRVVDSWRGVRPTMHYSVSREDYLIDHDALVLPDMDKLLESSHKKQKLRAHSDFYWNQACNEWALQFVENFDIMCESKGKNLASFELARQWKNIN